MNRTTRSPGLSGQLTQLHRSHTEGEIDSGSDPSLSQLDSSNHPPMPLIRNAAIPMFFQGAGSNQYGGNLYDSVPSITNINLLDDSSSKEMVGLPIDESLDVYTPPNFLPCLLTFEQQNSLLHAVLEASKEEVTALYTESCENGDYERVVDGNRGSVDKVDQKTLLSKVEEYLFDEISERSRRGFKVPHDREAMSAFVDEELKRAVANVFIDDFLSKHSFPIDEKRGWLKEPLIQAVTGYLGESPRKSLLGRTVIGVVHEALCGAASRYISSFGQYLLKNSMKEVCASDAKNWSVDRLLNLFRGDKDFSNELLACALGVAVNRLNLNITADERDQFIKESMTLYDESALISKCLEENASYLKMIVTHSICGRIIVQGYPKFDWHYVDSIVVTMLKNWALSLDEIRSLVADGRLDEVVRKAEVHWTLSSKYDLRLTTEQQQAAVLALAGSNLTRDAFDALLDDVEALEETLLQLLKVDSSLDNQKERLRQQVVNLRLNLSPRRVQQVVDTLVGLSGGSVWYLDDLVMNPEKLHRRVERFYAQGGLGSLSRRVIDIDMPQPTRSSASTEEREGEDSIVELEVITEALRTEPSAELNFRYGLSGLERNQQRFATDWGGPTKQALATAVSQMATLKSAVVTVDADGDSGKIDLGANPYPVNTQNYDRVNEEATKLGRLLGKALEMSVEGISTSYAQKVSERIIECVDLFRFGTEHSPFSSNGLANAIYLNCLQMAEQWQPSFNIETLSERALDELAKLFECVPDLKEHIFGTGATIQRDQLVPAINRYFVSGDGLWMKEGDETVSQLLERLLVEKMTPLCHFAKGFYSIIGELGKIDSLFRMGSDLSFTSVMSTMFQGVTLYTILKEERYAEEAQKIRVTADERLEALRPNDLSALKAKARHLFIRFVLEGAHADGGKALNEHITGAEMFDTVSGVVLALKAEGVSFAGHTCFNTLDITLAAIEGKDEEALLAQWKRHFDHILPQSKYFGMD